MTDSSTKKPLHVSGAGGPLPYIMLPVSRLDEVEKLLDAHHVRYEVDELAISLNDGPEMTVINLPRGTDGAAVQRLLDSIP
jgi:hypothetical protein